MEGELSLDALILSCGTGGGHGGTAYALKKELERRGHTADMMDPYTLINEHLGDNIGGAYVSMVRWVPGLFAALYQAGEIYRKLPIRSPVYAFNKRMAAPLRRYVAEHHYDIIIAPHMFPGTVIQAIKDEGADFPPSIYVATDYTCIPFTEEVGCDYQVIPSPRLVDEFAAKGIDPAKIRPFGIPVRREFSDTIPREELIGQLGLDPTKRYILLASGSMGSGKLTRVVRKLEKYLDVHPNHVLVVICGTNDRLYDRLFSRYEDHPQMILLHITDRMGAYMQVSDAIITKPGGLSVTEAAVVGKPMIFVEPIRGCESHNLKFFSILGMGADLVNHRGRVGRTLELLTQPEYAQQMIRLQHEEINPHAAEDVCDLAEEIVREEETA